MLEPIFMLAIDHRWQWEEWCDRANVSRSRIPEIKRLAAEAFLEARRASAAVHRSGALLVDLTYGYDAFEMAREAGAVVGNPAERAGVFPLQWTAPFAEALRGRFVKVLVRHRPDVPAPIVDQQRQGLLELQRWCETSGRPLVLEVLAQPAAGQADAEEFDRSERPAILAGYIREAYRAGIVPQYWKIEGMPDRAAFDHVEAAIREQPAPRQLILGKGAGMDRVRRWFDLAAGGTTAAGFAIGRTVYFEPATLWLQGRIDRAEARARIQSTYAAIVAMWGDAAGRAVVSR